MSKYCELTDFQDTLIAGNITDETLAKTDSYIDALLNQIGIDPSTITPADYPVLKQLAIYFASYLTCLEQTSGENDIYLQKAKAYKELYEKLEKRLIDYGLSPKDELSESSCFINISRG